MYIAFTSLVISPVSGETILSPCSTLNLIILGVLLGASVLLNISLITMMAVCINCCRQHEVNEAPQSVQIKTQSKIKFMVYDYILPK